MDSSSSIHDSKFNILITDKPKVGGLAKGKTRNLGRKTLGDISNIPQRCAASTQHNKAQPSSDAAKVILEQLQKENMALMKLLVDKDKLIELSGAEVHKLRVNLQMVKQQNLQLAQSNSQLLAELNSIKESQKSLMHELGCKNGLIIAKNFELEAKVKSEMCRENDSDNNKVTEPEETEVCTVAWSDVDKHYNTSTEQKSETLVLSDKSIQDNATSRARRLQTRIRQSARFKLDEPNIENVDDLQPCQLPNDDKMTANASKKEDKEGTGGDQMKVNDSKREDKEGIDGDKMKLNVSKKDNNKGNSLQDNKPQEHRKTSLSRPVREAAKKVQSYKEINVNMKMRRE